MPFEIMLQNSSTTWGKTGMSTIFQLVELEDAQWKLITGKSSSSVAASMSTSYFRGDIQQAEEKEAICDKASILQLFLPTITRKRGLFFLTATYFTAFPCKLSTTCKKHSLQQAWWGQFCIEQPSHFITVQDKNHQQSEGFVGQSYIQ